MKSRTALLSTIVIVMVILSYAAGFYAGKDKMDKFCGYVIQGSATGDHIALFSKHMAAIDAISAGNAGEAEKILRFLAKVDASHIIECEKDTLCTQLMGNSPPEDWLLKKASAN